MTGIFQAALKSAARHSATEVTSARKKQGKKCKQNERRRCNADAETCKAQVLDACDGNAECVLGANACCDTCSADGFVTCVLAAIAQNSAGTSLGLG